MPLFWRISTRKQGNRRKRSEYLRLCRKFCLETEGSHYLAAAGAWASRNGQSVAGSEECHYLLLRSNETHQAVEA